MTEKNLTPVDGDKVVMKTPAALKAQSKLTSIGTRGEREQHKDQKSVFSQYIDKETNGGRYTRQPTTAMGVERGEEELYDNLENCLQNIENEYIIRKTQQKLMRQQCMNSAGSKRGRQSSQNSMNIAPNSPNGKDFDFQQFADRQRQNTTSGDHASQCNKDYHETTSKQHSASKSNTKESFKQSFKN